MKLNNISFPYPVLGIRDDVKPLLSDDCVSIEIDQLIDSYSIKVSLKQENETITRLINEGFAEYTCEIDCQKAFLRESVSSKESTFYVNIPRRKVNGRVYLNFFVTVKQTILDYTNSGFNEDYEGYTFDLEPGDILVGFPQSYFDADIKYDKLQAAGSFMVIREDVTISQTRFDIAGDKIEIVLPSDMYTMYKNGIGERNMEVIHSSMAFNALCFALYNIQENSETLWARCVNTRIDTEPELAQFKDLDKIQVPMLAQALLGDPYKRMFENLQSQLDTNFAEEED